MDFGNNPHGVVYSRITATGIGIIHGRPVCSCEAIMPRNANARQKNTSAPTRAIYLRNAHAIIEQSAGGAFKFHRSWSISPNSAIMKHKLIFSEALVFVVDWRKVTKP